MPPASARAISSRVFLFGMPFGRPELGRGPPRDMNFYLIFRAFSIEGKILEFFLTT